MTPLSEQEKREILKLIEAGEPLPEKWRSRLFASKTGISEIGKEYRLVYEGKARREEVLAQTPAAPWQLVDGSARSIRTQTVNGGICSCGATTS